MLGRWLLNIPKNIFGTLDSVVYGFLATIAGLFTEISGVILIDNSTIKTIYERVFVVLAIFMLFRISISLINYLIDPNSFTDKSKGMGKLLSRCVISLLMLAMSRPVFNEMINLQGDLIGFVPRLVTGKTSKDGTSMGQTMALQAFSAFISANPECETAHKEPVLPESTYGIRAIVVQACEGKNSENEYDYSYFWSTLAGGFMMLMMLSYCIDIVVRAFKLGLLQLIAPIPIISYMNPSDKSFGIWIKTVASTYADLFIKLAVFYLSIFIIAETNLTGGIESSHPVLITLFIIIGVLFFMKDAAQFICDSLGIKSSGGVFGGLGKILGAAGIGAAAVGGGILAGKVAFGDLGPNAGFKDKAGALAKTIGGGIGGGVNGFKNMDAGDGSFKGAIGAGINAFGTPGRLKGDLSEKLSKQKSKYDNLMEYAESEGAKRYSSKSYNVNGLDLTADELAYYEQQSEIPDGDTGGFAREWFISGDFYKTQKELNAAMANDFIQAEYKDPKGDEVLKFHVKNTGLGDSAKNGNGYAAAKEQSDLRNQKITILNSKSNK